MNHKEDLIAGRNAVIEALRAKKPIDKIFVLDGCQDGPIRTIVREAKKTDAILKFVDKERLNQLTNEHHQGVVAIVAAYEYGTIEDLFKRAEEKGEDPFFILLDGIEDPHNLGAIIRTANLAGAHGVIIPKRRAVGLTSTVAKTSAGAINYTPVAKVTNIVRTIEELKEKIARLEEKIKGFDVDKKMSKAESFLSNNMNRLSLTLDFEEEYRPIDLNFGLTDGSFDIYQHQKSNENIHLYEMGSGANWVSCHIALFLSFLRFFATQDNSPMPLVMFFDQPSQVYFPQGNDKDEITQADLIAVNKMYKTIFDEINSIGEDTGILPQIIIVDHVDGKNLECKEEFERYIRCNWRNDTGLI